MHIYIHIPFCAQKCSYCTFAITPVFDTFKKNRYLAYLKNEIQSGIRKFKINTVKSIYFGGGTPSLLSKKEISEILSLFDGKIQSDTEISLEGNPEDFDATFIQDIVSVGINRISLGVQSLNPKTLHTVGRSSPQNIHNALKNLKNHTHISLNIDYILGLPYSSKGETLKDIKTLHTTYPFISHTSVYILEKGHYPKSWQPVSMSEKEIGEDFLEILDFFADQKWHHYEYSNFSKPGYECVHNRGYWNHSDSIGFGLSAASYLQGKRWNNSPSFAGYYRGEKSLEENLHEENIRIEKIMFGLRTSGAKKSLFSENKYYSEYIKQGWIQENNDTIFLTKKGTLFIDTILADVI